MSTPTISDRRICVMCGRLFYLQLVNYGEARKELSRRKTCSTLCANRARSAKLVQSQRALKITMWECSGCGDLYESRGKAFICYKHHEETDND